MFTNSLNHLQKNIHSIYINRITILTLLISILLSFNTLYFQSIGKGVGLYSGLFQITTQSNAIEIFLLLVGIVILFSWPLIKLTEQKHQESSSFGSSLTINNLNIVKSDHYSLIAIFSILGGSLLMSSLDLLSMYLSLELQSFSLYILATLNKDKLSATSAGLKYFLLGGLSSCFILLGAAIIYSYTGLTQLESIHALISTPCIPNSVEGGITSQFGLTLDLNRAFTIGLVIILIGFLFKVSAAPFYHWAPDVYDGTPTIVTVWLTIVAKLTLFIFLQGLIDFSFSDISLSLDWNLFNPSNLFSSSTYLEQASSLDAMGHIVKTLLLICSLLSLIIGTVAGLSQIKIKRLLAYSSVSHVGFLLLALAIYSQKSVDSFLFYIVQYSLTSLNIFLIILALGYFLHSATAANIESFSSSPHASIFSLTKESSVLPSADDWGADGKIIENGPDVSRERTMVSSFNRTLEEPQLDLEYLIDLKDQLTKNIILSLSLGICLFSMAGIPPLIGFFSKQFVLFSAIENGNIFLSVVAIIVSVISASYYLKLIKITFFERRSVSSGNTIFFSESEKKPMFTGIVNFNVQLTSIHSYIISILTLMILFFFLNPSIILNVTELISIIIFNT
jgi:NADH-ubiquinone oxidoreductase chain 2